MTRFVPLAVALLCTISLAAELPVSTVVYTGAPGPQAFARAATDGTDFLVAWRDNRGVFAARVSREGTLLDPTGIPLPDPPHTAANYGPSGPAFAVWTGGVYLVGWEDFNGRELRYVRVGRDGRALDAAPQEIGGSGVYITPFAASNGSTTIVIYGGSEYPTTSIHAALFDAAGNLVKGNVPLPELAGMSVASGSLASNGRSFLVAYPYWDGKASYLMTARLSADGSVGTPHNLGPIPFYAAGLASNGDDYVLVFADAQKQLASVKLDADGNPGERIVLADNTMPVAIARYGSGYVVAASDNTAQGRIAGLQLDRNGASIAPVALVNHDANPSSPVFAANPTATLVVSSDNRLGWTVGPDLFARVLGNDGDALVSQAAARQDLPRVASAGDVSLAVWLEYRAGDYADLRAARIAADGTPLDGDGLELGTALQQSPQVVFDGTNFVVAWLSANGDLTVKRVSRDGVAGAGYVAIAGFNAFGSFALGSNGREAVLAWSGAYNTPPHLRVARVAPDGTLPPPYVDVAASDKAEADQIAIAATSDTWLVTWALHIMPDYCHICGAPPPAPTHDILAARLNSSLFLLDGAPIGVATDENSDEKDPAAASNGRDFLVAWDTYTDVRGRTIQGDGTLGETTIVANGTTPDVVAHGNRYRIAWAGVTGDLLYADFAANAAGALLAHGGTISQPRVRLTPTLAVYERIATEPVYGSVARVFVQTIPPAQRLRSVRR